MTTYSDKHAWMLRATCTTGWPGGIDRRMIFFGEADYDGLLIRASVPAL